MLLTEKEKAMARGDHGPGIKRCMDILVKLGESVGAERMVPIASAHTMPKEPLELLAEMTEGVDELAAMTTLHPCMSAFSPRNWAAQGLDPEFARDELELFDRRREHYLRCGFLETYTCVPMLVGNLPRMGECISWIGSGAQLLSNSVLGARCNRDGTVVTLAAAVTGRAPLHGMFLDENRLGRVLVRFEGVDPATLTHAELGAVGYHVGAIAGGRNVVVDGMPAGVDLDSLKHLLAPLPVSGAVLLCHVVGVTPEAPTLEAALGGREPEEIVVVGPEEIRQSLGRFAGSGASPDMGTDVDMAVFGCPHCSVSEIKTLARLAKGRKLAHGKRLWIGMPHQHYHLLKQMGIADTVEDAGGVFLSSCMATIPDAPIPEGVRTVATNSFKAAHYIASLTKGAVKVVVGDMDACVDAVTGGAWKEDAGKGGAA